jgi:hypothetical protein
LNSGSSPRELQRLDVDQPTFHRSAVDQHRRRPRPAYQRVVADIGNRWQLDLTSTIEHQQQPPADHVAERAVGLPPLPGLAELFR